MKETASKTPFILGLLACIILNVFVFYPSFFHTARGTDHLNYLLETGSIENLSESMAASYSYGRTRSLIQGDTFLFRPLFYALFVFLKFFFRYDFFFWQIAGFLLHLIVQCQCYRIFRLITPRWTAALFTLSMAFLLLPQETVVRHHLNGYLIFIILYLEAIYRYFYFLKNDENQKKHTVILLISLLLSCFAFELGVFVIFFLALFHRFFMKRTINTQTSSAVPLEKLLCAPMFIYLTINAIDFLCHKPSFNDKTFFVSINFKGHLHDFLILVSNMGNVALLWLKGHLFPSFVQFQIDEWDTFIGLSFATIKDLQVMNILYLLAFLIFFGACLVNIRRTKLSFDPSFKKYTAIGLFHLSLMLFYVFLYSLTRLSDKPDYLYNALHHYYFINTFLFLSLFFCFYPRLQKIIAPNKNLTLSFAALLAFFIIINGAVTFDFFAKRAKLDDPLRRYILSMDQFIQRNKNKPGFSFKAEKTTVDNFFVDSRGDKPPRILYMAEFLFEQHYKEVDPMYYIVFSQKKGMRVFKQREEAQMYIHQIEDKFIILNRNLIPYGSDIQVSY